tara:strand:+ start:3208 stop:3354 length:147 start_codon:yes stop_codon:yes gene_type:complete
MKNSGAGDAQGLGFTRLFVMLALKRAARPEAGAKKTLIGGGRGWTAVE